MSRCNNVDFLRGIGIFLVVFGHVWRGLRLSGHIDSSIVFELVDRAIYLFHMPLFFFLSGLFFEKILIKNGFREIVKSRLILLIYPLVLWSYVHFSVKYLAGDLVNSPVTSTDLAYAPFPPKEQFWFLWALFLIQIGLCITIFSPRLMRPLFFAFGLAALGVVLSGTISQIPSALAPVFVGALTNLPFFVAGVFLAKFALDRPENGWMAIFGGVVFIAAQLAFMLVWQAPFLAVNFIAAFFCIIGLVMLVPWVLAQFSQTLLVRGLIFIGTISFSIFVAHVIFTSGARVILIALGVDNLPLHLMAGTVAGLVGPTGLFLIAKKFEFSLLAGLGR